MMSRLGLLLSLAGAVGVLVGVRAARRGRFRIAPLLWALLWGWAAFLVLVLAETLLRQDYPPIAEVLPQFLVFSMLQGYLLLPAIAGCALGQTCCAGLPEGRDMTTLRAFVIIGASTVVCTVGGGLLGYVVGVAAPGYYRAVFRGGDAPGFVPAEVGLGLGVTQGAAAGLIVGIVAVLAVAWYGSRAARLIKPDGDAT
jgi:hypothetical protein